MTPRAAPQVGAWWVSDEDEATYAELKKRWDGLIAWGVGDKLPHHRQNLAAWREYAARWDGGDEDTDKLLEQTLVLNLVEREAAEPKNGYQRLGGDVKTEDPEKANPVLNAIDEAAAEVEKYGVPLPNAGTPAAVEKKVRETAAAAKEGWDKLPLTYKIAGGALLTGLVFAAAGKAAGEVNKLAKTAGVGARRDDWRRGR